MNSHTDNRLRCQRRRQGEEDAEQYDADRAAASAEEAALPMRWLDRGVARASRVGRIHLLRRHLRSRRHKQVVVREQCCGVVSPREAESYIKRQHTPGGQKYRQSPAKGRTRTVPSTYAGYGLVIVPLIYHSTIIKYTYHC